MSVKIINQEKVFVPYKNIKTILVDAKETCLYKDNDSPSFKYITELCLSRKRIDDILMETGINTNDPIRQLLGELTFISYLEKDPSIINKTIQKFLNKKF